MQNRYLAEALFYEYQREDSTDAYYSGDYTGGAPTFSDHELAIVTGGPGMTRLWNAHLAATQAGDSIPVEDALNSLRVVGNRKLLNGLRFLWLAGTETATEDEFVELVESVVQMRMQSGKPAFDPARDC